MGETVEKISSKKSPIHYSVEEKKNFPFIFIILLLPTVHIIVFFFYVNFSSFALAFQDASGNWSFESIIYAAQGLFGGRDRWGWNPSQMLWKSILLWCNLNILCTIVGTLTTFILTKHMICSKIFRVIYTLPGIVGAVVFSSIMRGIYDYDGIILTFINKLGISVDPLILKNGLLGSEKTAYWVMMAQAFIFSITGGNFILAGAYMKIPEEIFESARMEGAGFFTETFKIAIPCAWPTITTILTFNMCSFFTCDYSFYLYSMGTGQSGLQSIGFYLYQFEVTLSGANDTKYLYGYVSAFGMFITILTVPVVILGRKILSRMSDIVDF